MRKRYEPRDENGEDGFDEGPSKSQRKRDMLALEELGVAMLQLTDEQLDALVDDEGLRTALRDLRRFTNHGARKRQMGYVGKLLRDFDVTPFRAAVAALHADKVRSVRQLRDIEHWRERLIAETDAWAAWTQAHPAGDTAALKKLVADARHERQRAAVTGSDPKGRAYRELFRAVRAALAPTAAPEAR